MWEKKSKCTSLMWDKPEANYQISPIFGKSINKFKNVLEKETRRLRDRRSKHGEVRSLTVVNNLRNWQP